MVKQELVAARLEKLRFEGPMDDGRPSLRDSDDGRQFATDQGG